MKYFLTFILFSSSAIAANFELKPGLWKLETNLEVTGGEKSIQGSAPQRQEDDSITEMCVTQEESQIEKSLVKDGECKFINITQSRDELSGDITCTKNRTGKARWKKVSEDEFIMTMETSGDAQPVRLTQKGRFIRKDCAKS